jgi:hypothetical protein
MGLNNMNNWNNIFKSNVYIEETGTIHFLCEFTDKDVDIVGLSILNNIRTFCDKILSNGRIFVVPWNSPEKNITCKACINKMHGVFEKEI